MRKNALMIASCLMAVLAAPAALEAKPKLTPQQRLDKMLEGRVAGKPVSCISMSASRDTEIIDRTAIVYSSGNTIYVNKTTNPASLDSDDIMVTHTWGSGPCKLDTIHMQDRTMGGWRGFVGLEEFVPYKRVPKAG